MCVVSWYTGTAVPAGIINGSVFASPELTILRSVSLTTQIFIGLILGVLIGWLWPSIGMACAPGAEIFLRLIKSIIAPLVFATLVVGIAGAGSGHAVGRL